jgi:hypothetical protein
VKQIQKKDLRSISPLQSLQGLLNPGFSAHRSVGSSIDFKSLQSAQQINETKSDAYRSSSPFQQVLKQNQKIQSGIMLTRSIEATKKRNNTKNKVILPKIMFFDNQHSHDKS